MYRYVILVSILVITLTEVISAKIYFSRYNNYKDTEYGRKPRLIDLFTKNDIHIHQHRPPEHYHHYHERSPYVDQNNKLNAQTYKEYLEGIFENPSPPTKPAAYFKPVPKLIKNDASLPKDIPLEHHKHVIVNPVTELIKNDANLVRDIPIKKQKEVENLAVRNRNKNTKHVIIHYLKKLNNEDKTSESATPSASTEPIISEEIENEGDYNSESEERNNHADDVNNKKKAHLIFESEYKITHQNEKAKHNITFDDKEQKNTSITINKTLNHETTEYKSQQHEIGVHESEKPKKTSAAFNKNVNHEETEYKFKHLESSVHTSDHIRKQELETKQKGDQKNTQKSNVHAKEHTESIKINDQTQNDNDNHLSINDAHKKPALNEYTKRFNANKSYHESYLKIWT